jgi:hypothetical protein
VTDVREKCLLLLAKCQAEMMVMLSADRDQARAEVASTSDLQKFYDKTAPYLERVAKAVFGTPEYHGAMARDKDTPVLAVVADVLERMLLPADGKPLDDGRNGDNVKGHEPVALPPLRASIYVDPEPPDSVKGAP